MKQGPSIQSVQNIIDVQPVTAPTGATFKLLKYRKKAHPIIGIDSSFEHSYWVDLDGGCFNFTIEAEKRYFDSLAWAKKMFGPSVNRDNPRWAYSKGKFRFKNEQDRIAFLMRWS